ncbi:MAG: hypothetical protein Q9208_004634 [Pyrenodesmia sp. 3 TL-2023]
MLLSALWARECKEHKDFNFGIRSLMQALSLEALPQLDYASPLGEVYEDLTIELLRLTGSPEILLIAMKSNVAGQPSEGADLLVVLQTSGRILKSVFTINSAARIPPSTWFLTYEDLLRSFVTACNSVATEGIRFLVADDELVHRDGQLPSIRLFTVCVARSSSPRIEQGGNRQAAATPPSATLLHSEECRPQIGDKMVRVIGTKDMTVVRRTGDKMRFVDAVEDLVRFRCQARYPHQAIVARYRVASLMDIS